jgi:hypothetical protein
MCLLGYKGRCVYTGTRTQLVTCLEMRVFVATCSRSGKTQNHISLLGVRGS